MTTAPEPPEDCPPKSLDQRTTAQGCHRFSMLEMTVRATSAAATESLERYKKAVSLGDKEVRKAEELSGQIDQLRAAVRSKDLGRVFADIMKKHTRLTRDLGTRPGRDFHPFFKTCALEGLVSKRSKSPRIKIRWKDRPASLWICDQTLLAYFVYKRTPRSKTFKFATPIGLDTVIVDCAAKHGPLSFAIMNPYPGKKRLQTVLTCRAPSAAEKKVWVSALNLLIDCLNGLSPCDLALLRERCAALGKCEIKKDDIPKCLRLDGHCRLSSGSISSLSSARTTLSTLSWVSDRSLQSYRESSCSSLFRGSSSLTKNSLTRNSRDEVNNEGSLEVIPRDDIREAQCAAAGVSKGATCTMPSKASDESTESMGASHGVRAGAGTLPSSVQRKTPVSRKVNGTTWYRHADTQGKKYWYTANGYQQWQPPDGKACDWVLVQHIKGPYWYNHVSRRTSWCHILPERAAAS